MHRVLSPQHQQWIQHQIESGRYQSAEDVINQALTLLEQQEMAYEQWIQETRQKIASGITQLDQGQGVSGEVVIAQLRQKINPNEGHWLIQARFDVLIGL